MTEVQINAVDEELLDTIMAPDVEFTGTMSFKRPLMVKGKVSGRIQSESEFYIDERAVVEADIAASVVSIKGSLKGDIAAAERVELFSTASLEGDVTAPRIAMEPGCRFNGVCRMSSPPRDDAH